MDKKMDIITIEYSNLSKKTCLVNNTIFFSVTHQLIMDYLSEGNVIDNPNIILLKSKKLSELRLIREKEQYQSFEYTNATDTYTLPNTEKAKIRYIGKYQAWNGALTKTWLDIKGVSIDFTETDFKEIIKQIEDLETALYLKEASLIKDIQNLVDLAYYTSLEAFDIQIKWDSYGE